MRHADHVRLIADGVPQGSGGTWADLGCGTGAFTLALADLLGPSATIHAVDRDRGALAELRAAFVSAVPVADLRVDVADFTKPLALRDLDGVVMANSLHFVDEKTAVLKRVRAMLRPGGRFVLVEYDSDRGNEWVPYPVSFESWKELASEAGFVGTRRLATIPSRFLRQIYSAVSLQP
jgi:ubiquinone/menaquinone biosynthesis C-methylase UbiE